MVRTAGTVFKSAGGKSSKTRGLCGVSSSSISSGSTSRRSIGGNKLVQRPTPKWQKAINIFLKNNPIKEDETQQEPLEDVKTGECDSISVETTSSIENMAQKENTQPSEEGTSKELDSVEPETESNPQYMRIPVCGLGARYMPDFALLEQFENDNVKGSKRNKHVNYLA